MSTNNRSRFNASTLLGDGSVYRMPISPPLRVASKETSREKTADYPVVTTTDGDPAEASMLKPRSNNVAPSAKTSS